MGEQDDDPGCVAACESAWKIGSMTAAIRLGREVVDSSEIEAFRTSNGNALISKNAKAPLLQEGEPPLQAWNKVFVISSDEECSVGRLDLCDRLHEASKLLDRPVDQVAGDRHQVGLKGIDALDYPLHVTAPNRRADVNIGNLSYPISRE